MQLILAFLEPLNRPPTPSPASKPWDQVDEASRVAALEILARLIAKMAVAESGKARNND
jgi:hypothetical protein